MNLYIKNNLKNKSYYIADQALNPEKILQWKENYIMQVSIVRLKCYPRKSRSQISHSNKIIS
jgi:hypothetical protein